MKIRMNSLGDKNVIGKKVTALRCAQNLKQVELAARLQTRGMDISETSLSRLEGQHRLVQDWELLIIAQALGVSVADLLEGAEPPTKNRQS